MQQFYTSDDIKRILEIGSAGVSHRGFKTGKSEEFLEGVVYCGSMLEGIFEMIDRTNTDAVDEKDKLANEAKGHLKNDFAGSVYAIIEVAEEAMGKDACKKAVAKMRKEYNRLEEAVEKFKKESKYFDEKADNDTE